MKAFFLCDNECMNTSIKKGFSLVEIVVVIAIIALISSIVYASTSDARQKASYAKSSQEIIQIETAIELSLTADTAGNGLISQQSFPVQQDINAPLTNDSSFYKTYLAGSLGNEAPTVGSAIAAEGESQNNYIYISDGVSAKDSSGEIYACEDSTSAYVIMYKKRVELGTVIRFEKIEDKNAYTDPNGNIVAQSEVDGISLWYKFGPGGPFYYPPPPPPGEEEPSELPDWYDIYFSGGNNIESAGYYICK